MGSEPNLPVKQSVSIGTMLNFDGDGHGHGHGHGDSTCKQSRVCLFMGGGVGDPMWPLPMMPWHIIRDRDKRKFFCVKSIIPNFKQEGTHHIAFGSDANIPPYTPAPAPFRYVGSLKRKETLELHFHRKIVSTVGSPYVVIMNASSFGAQPAYFFPDFDRTWEENPVCLDCEYYGEPGYPNKVHSQRAKSKAKAKIFFDVCRFLFDLFRFRTHFRLMCIYP